MSTFQLPPLDEAIARLDNLFATAFSSNDKAMQDYVALKFAMKHGSSKIEQIMLALFEVRVVASSGADMPHYDQDDHCRLRDKHQRIVAIIDALDKEGA